jgi:hypothetical protein
MAVKNIVIPINCRNSDTLNLSLESTLAKEEK